jgi:type VI secretion system protein VasD
MSDVGIFGWSHGACRCESGLRRARRLGAGIVVASIAACASAPKPTEISGVLQASANVNPSVSKRPSPLLVRVYELKAATAFNSADFVSLYQRDQAELGGELVAREEFILNPGESKPMAKKVAPETRFIGVLAAFRDLDHAKWRSVVPLQLGQKQRIVISAEELSITATLAK